MRILLSNYHVYRAGPDNGPIRTNTPTYAAILQQEGDVIPAGKQNCIKRVGSKTFFDCKFTKNAKIPPPLFRAIDQLKNSGDPTTRVIAIGNSIGRLGMDINYRSDIHHGGTVLHAAAAAYAVEPLENIPAGLMRILLAAQGINARIQDKSGRTALHVAAEAGSVEAIQTLLDHNPDLHAIRDKKGKTAFEMAVLSGRRTDEVKDIFYTRFATNYGLWKPSAVRDAILNRFRYPALRDIKPLLNNRNLDVNYRFPAAQAEEEERGGTLLQAAVLSYKQIDAESRQPYRQGLIHQLLQDPRVDPNKDDHQGRTALHQAALLPASTASRELLRDPRIDINKRDNEGKTPLLHAISQFSGQTDTTQGIDVLINDHRIELDAEDHFGRGVLHHLVMRRHPQTLRYLTEH